MNPKVSVVIPSLNSIKYIEECLASVRNQTLQDIEIICVDANSNDGTLEYLQDSQKQDSRIQLILSDKRSYGYQMNLGIKAAKGEYLGIVESDDYIKPNMYEELYRIAKEKNVEVVKSNMLEFEDKNTQREFTHTRMISWDKSLYYQILSSKDIRVFTKTGIMNPSGIFKTSFLRENQIYHNESLGAAYQDTGFWFFTHLLASKIYFVNHTFYCYRQDNESSSVNNISYNKALMLSKEYDFIRKTLEHYSKFAHLIPLVNYLRFGGYNWILGRIDQEESLEFLQRIQKEFKEIEAKGELDLSYFEEWHKEKLLRILKDPKEFYENICLKPKGAVERVKNHLAYKLGNAILKAKTPLRILRLPLNLRQIYKNTPNTHLEIENFSDYFEGLKVKKHLSFRVGITLINAYNKLGLGILTIAFKTDFKPSKFQNL